MLKLSTIFRSILSSVMLSLLLAAGSGCKDSSQSQGAGWQPNVPFGTLPPGFDSFPERWNKQINDRLAREEAAKQKEIRELRDKFFKEEDSKVREKLQSKLIADEAALSVIHRRQTEGDYIKFKTPADIPQDLKWEDGLDNPEIGDPNAKKGGVLRQWAPGSYPDTFRPNGPNSGFRGPLYDEIIIGLVSIHPVTGKIIPGIAHKWAESPDRRTVYFELDPDARYTDGAKVKAIDLLVNMYIRTSEYSQDVFYNNFFYQNASNITIYDGGLKAEQQVNVVLKGQALPKPNLTAVTATAPTSLTDSSYVANWTAAAEVVDYYIVTRTQYLPSGTVTTTEEAPSNSLQITGRRSDCDETYSVQSSRLGFTSPASNTMLVKASGVEGIEAEPLMIGWTNRGFMVLADRLLNLRALTPDGRTVYFATEAQRGTEVELPAGIYIITAQGGFSPVKIVVAQPKPCNSIHNRNPDTANPDNSHQCRIVRVCYAEQTVSLR